MWTWIRINGKHLPTLVCQGLNEEGADGGFTNAAFAAYCYFHRIFPYLYLKKIVTTHVVRLKLFRLKAEGVRRTRLPYFGKNIWFLHQTWLLNALFPNSLQPSAYPSESYKKSVLSHSTKCRKNLQVYLSAK